DHVDHVRTQLPYAMLTGSVAVLVGNALTVLGVPVWISLLAGSALIVAVVRFYGKTLEPQA
ncbi:MAG: Na+/H+ antiporter NhaC family protein, partial [Acidobacteriota bacterium]